MVYTPEELNLLTKKQLLEKCHQLNISRCLSKTKKEIVEIIINHNSQLTKDDDQQKSSTSISSTPSTSSTSSSTITKLKFIDLFCGIGGFHQALTNIGAECVFASDIDEKCRKIYETNYKIKPDGDITKVKIEDIPAFDILCGGFPCQPFSKSGHQKGFDDTRGTLFFNICKIVEHHKPKYLLLENVRNLSSHDSGNTWKVIYDNIDKLGYYTYHEPVILNVLHFNIPQNRERVIIMCKRKDLGQLNELPNIPKNPKLHLKTGIKDIIDKTNLEYNKKYKLDGKMKDVEGIWDDFIKLLIKNDIKIPKFPIWTDWWDQPTLLDLNHEDTKIRDFYKKYKNWIDKNRQFYLDYKSILDSWLLNSRNNNNWKGAVRKFEWQAGSQKAKDGMSTLLWTARGSGIRVKRPDYIPTLVAMSMIPVYGPESRKLTPRELLRAQSFPDSFQYDEKTIFKQIGNSVNVKMIEQSAKFLILNQPLF
jgi:DNA (cytosine-5)-methyltransferase 1